MSEIRISCYDLAKVIDKVVEHFGAFTIDDLIDDLNDNPDRMIAIQIDGIETNINLFKESEDKE